MKVLDRDAVLDAIPTNWLDNLLTGPDAVIPSGTDCRVIERLLKAVRARIAALPIIDNI